MALMKDYFSLHGHSLNTATHKTHTFFLSLLFAKWVASTF